MHSLIKRIFNKISILRTVIEKNCKLRLFPNAVVKLHQCGYKYPVFIRTGTSDVTVFHDVVEKGAYQISYDYLPEPEAFAPKVIVDCGANIGLATIKLIKWPSQKCRN